MEQQLLEWNREDTVVEEEDDENEVHRRRTSLRGF